MANYLYALLDTANNKIDQIRFSEYNARLEASGNEDIIIVKLEVLE